MIDKTLTSLLAKVRRLEEDYEGMSSKIDLLIHSINNLYDEVYKDKSCCNCKSMPEEEEDVEDESTATEDKETGNEIESVADVILAIAEELERRKKL